MSRWIDLAFACMCAMFAPISFANATTLKGGPDDWFFGFLHVGICAMSVRDFIRKSNAQKPTSTRDGGVAGT